MGIIVIAMIFVTQAWLAMILMVVIGGLAGFFVVPMNALLQHRGHHLVGAGRSIAVQNFNENTSILLMIALYSLLLNVGYSIYTVIVVFGLFVAGTMTLVQVVVPQQPAPAWQGNRPPASLRARRGSAQEPGIAPGDACSLRHRRVHP